MNRFERGLKKVREHPARYIAPSAVTALRPKLGWDGMKAAQEGDWKKARRKFRQSSATDYIDGWVARFLDAATKGGAILDPVGDGLERAEAAIALAPKMNKVAVVATVLLEGHNLILNKTIQKGRKEPFVPKAAKWGSAEEAAGADVLMTGIIDDSPTLRGAGQLAIVHGATVRNSAYRKEYKRIKASQTPQK